MLRTGLITHWRSGELMQRLNGSATSLRNIPGEGVYSFCRAVR